MTAPLDALPRFAILIPAYNERPYIATVVAECRRAARHVVVVDDGSTDGTGALARRHGAVVLRNSVRSGLASALQRGFAFLAANGNSAIVTLDGDGAHYPDRVRDLLVAHVQSKADLTIGTRFATATSPRDVPSSKVAANYFATRVINTILGSELTDVLSGMRVVGPRAATLAIETSGFGIAIELIIRSVHGGLSVHEHPIPVRYDATELFCTSRRELVDFLDAAVSFAAEERLARNLRWLRAEVGRFRACHVIVGSQPLVLYPLPAHAAYVFQFQSPWYTQAASRRRWRILEGVT